MYVLCVSNPDVAVKSNEPLLQPTPPPLLPLHGLCVSIHFSTRGYVAVNALTVHESTAVSVSAQKLPGLIFTDCQEVSGSTREHRRGRTQQQQQQQQYSVGRVPNVSRYHCLARKHAAVAAR